MQWESPISSPAVSAQGSNSEKMLSLVPLCTPSFPPVRLPGSSPTCSQGYFCSSHEAPRVGTYRKSVNTRQPAEVPRAMWGNKEAVLFSAMKLLKPNAKSWLTQQMPTCSTPTPPLEPTSPQAGEGRARLSHLQVLPVGLSLPCHCPERRSIPGTGVATDRAAQTNCPW